MKYANKMMVVPYVQQIENPDIKYLSKLDGELSQIINSKLKPDERVKIYNDKLDSFKSHLPESINITDSSQPIVDEEPTTKTSLKLALNNQKVLKKLQGISLQLGKTKAESLTDRSLKEILEILRSGDVKYFDLNTRLDKLEPELKHKKLKPSIEPEVLPRRYPTRSTHAQLTRLKLAEDTAAFSPIKRNDLTLDLSDSDLVGKGWISNKNYFK